MSKAENNNEELDYENETYQVSLREYKEKIALYRKNIEAYKAEVAKVIEKSNDMFEKQLIYVAAGTIAASVFIVEKFLPNIRAGFIFLLLCWACCGVAIIVNMLSHYINMLILPKTLEELNNAETSEFDPAKADKRRKITKIINGVTLFIYVIGLGFFVTYIIINIDNMNNDKSTKVTTPDETKGYQLNTTAPPKPTPPPPPPPKPKS
jgi:hypothetical protein